MKFNEITDPNFRKIVEESLVKRWHQLNDLTEKHSDNCIQFLFITNSGGAVACLGFIGARGDAVGKGVYLALCLFAMGVIMNGAMKAFLYHRMDGLLEGWNSDTESFYNSQIELADLHKRDEERVGSNTIETILGYVSFACFILGCIAGGISLLKWWPQIINFFC